MQIHEADSAAWRDVLGAGCDSVGVLEQALALCMPQKPMSEAERAALLQKTAAVAKGGVFERFKTSAQFDGTAANPQWLESAQL